MIRRTHERHLKLCLVATTVALRSMLMLVLAAVSTSVAQAQTFSIFYNFKGGSDGGTPVGNVVEDATGNLYGAVPGGPNIGLVYKLDTHGTETVLHTFNGGKDGAYPGPDVVRDNNGNLYGTTFSGGTSNYGTVYRIDPTGAETILYNFAGGTKDGCHPLGGLVLDRYGELFGMARECGAFGLGTVFKVARNGKETVLHSFAGGSSDGENPTYNTPIIDSTGILYGVVWGGGPSKVGVAFKMDQKGRLTVLHGFAGGSGDGCYPLGKPAMDSDGNLYGTANWCGAFSYGTVWRVSNKGRETILHNFTGSDGEYPNAGVVRDSKGNLYGDALYGGASGYGTVYRLSRAGQLSVLHSFVNTDGSYPMGGLLLDAQGHLYGKTEEGGTWNGGVVWTIQ